MKRTTALLAAALALGGAATCFAQDEKPKTLTIGDKAPALDIAHWLKGEEIKEFESGKVYVLEFWATWCGPCRASMPHVSKLQEEYKDYDVTVIGVSDEPLQTVVDFLFKTDKKDNLTNQERTRYTLTTDPDESVKKDFFRAAGQRGIPCAFIIGKDGCVEWIGHPMGMDEPLSAVVHDTWDRDAFKASWGKSKEAETKSSAILARVQKAADDKDWEGVIDGLDQLIDLDEKYASYKVQKFLIYLKELDDPTRGYAFGREIAFDHWDDAMILNQLAWFTVDTEGVKTRDLDFAMKAAMRANELTKGEDAAILDTVARVHYEKGDLQAAIEWQSRAVEFAKDDSMGQEIRETLEKYKDQAKGG